MLDHAGGIKAVRDHYHTLALVRLFRFARKDGSVRRYTTHDRIVEYSSEEYTPLGGVNGEAFENEAGANAATWGVRFPIDDQEWMTDDLRVRLWSDAQLTVYEVDWRWPFLGAWRTRWGLIQDVEFSGEVGRCEVRSVADFLERPIGGVHTRLCPYVLGEDSGHSHCNAVVNAAGTWTGEVVASSGFSGANKRRVFRVRLLSGLGQKPERWYRGGNLTWWTGDNADIVADPVGTPVDGINRFEVRKYQNVVTSPSGSYVDRIELWEPTHRDIAIGDTFQIVPGCMKRRGTDCHSKFGVVESFGGHPYMPAPDRVVHGATT